jgi:hypothetical protein
MEQGNRMTLERDITVTPANGYFAHLVVYLVALQGFVHSTEIYNAGSAKRWIRLSWTQSRRRCL